MYYLQNFSNNTCYGCFYRKKFFKIKINKIVSKIDNVPKKKKSGLVIFVVLINKVVAHVTTRKPKSTIEKWVLEELEYKN